MYIVIRGARRLETAQLALADRSHLLQSTLESLQDPIFVIDAGGRVVAWNEAFLRLSGWDPVKHATLTRDQLLSDRSPIMYSPLTHFYVAATCNDFPGWSCDNRVPELMKAFTRAATVEERKKIAADIQMVSYEMVPSVMWGQFTIPAGYRTDLKGLIQSSYPMFWEVDR